MALPTYLAIVNEVLERLREPTVSTVTENTLSTLIGRYVNDTKRSVNDAYDWDALNTYISVVTINGQWADYSIANAGLRFRIHNVINITDRTTLSMIDRTELDTIIYLTNTPQSAAPSYFNLAGVDTNGDATVSFAPVPDRSYVIQFSLVVPEENFAVDTDTTKMPKEPIVLGALARALVERGEDGGQQSSEAYAMFKNSLADFIAIESSRSPENDAWESV